MVAMLFLQAAALLGAAAAAYSRKAGIKPAFAITPSYF